MILESFARCFNPLDPCTKVCSSKDDGNGKRSPPSAGRAFGRGCDAVPPRAVSRSDSSSGSRRQGGRRQRDLSADLSYDADGVARAKKTHHRVSAEALAARSMKRKLEIFRGTGREDEARRSPPRTASRKDSPSRRSPPPPSNGRPSPRHGQHLDLSDDEEELLRFAQSRKRFACGVAMDRGAPLSSVARFFNLGLAEAQKPFGLCFATPVRTPSAEDVAALSDDRLTDDEYARRHAGAGGSTAPATPDGDQGSHCEEETISSTLYFDQKYSHVVQTRPPMPLFQEHMLSGGGRGDDLTRMISSRRAKSAPLCPPVETLVTSRGRRRRGYGGGSDGGSPGKGGGSREPPSPVRISKDSLSAATPSEEESIEHVQKLLDPEVVGATMAEI